MEIIGLHTLICEVTDMDASVAFYRDLLGCTVGFQSPHWTTVFAGTTKIGLHPPFERSGDARGGGWIFGFEVTDIRGLRRKLEDAGMKLPDYHDTPAGAILEFTDPDGNRLQAVQPGMKRAELGV